VAIERQHAPGMKHDESFFVTAWHERFCAAHPDMAARYPALASPRATSAIFEKFSTVIKSLKNGRRVAIEAAKELAPRHFALGVTAEEFAGFSEHFAPTVASVWDAETPLSKKQLFFMTRFINLMSNTIVHSMNILAEQHGGKPVIRAPHHPPLTVVFTDIESSTKLWAVDPDDMAEVVRKHHEVIRATLGRHGGCEVKTVGDSFMIAFHDPVCAVCFCVELQAALMVNAPFTSAFRMLDDPEGEGDPAAWDARAPRVRAGMVHCPDAASVTAVFEPVPNRYDYYGPNVNLCARVQDKACGGQTLCDAATLDAIAAHPKFATATVAAACETLPPPLANVALDDGSLSNSLDARLAAFDLSDVAVMTKAITMGTITGRHYDKAPARKINAANPVKLEDVLVAIPATPDGAPVALKGVSGEVTLFSLLPVALAGRAFDIDRRVK